MTNPEFPVGWRVVKLGDTEIGYTTSGGTPDRSNPEYYGGDIPWVKSGELDDNWIYNTEEKITLEGLEASAAKVFPPGTLLIAMYGATTGKTAMLRTEASTNQAVCAIFPKNSSFDSQFMQFQMIFLRPRLLASRSGGAQPNINQNIINSLDIVLPPLPEQHAIAHVLRSVQQAKEIRRRELALERERKAALMEHLFTRGTGGEPAKQTETGEMPESWQLIELGKVSSRLQYGLSQLGGPAGRYPILRMNNLSDGRIDPSDLQYVDLEPDIASQFKLDKGDILFNRTNSLDLVGKVALFESDDDFVFASYLVRVVVKQSVMDSSFLNAFLNWEATQRRLKMQATRAVSQSNISAGKLGRFRIALPPLQEQQRIAEIWNSFDEKISALERELQILDELFKAMLEELMSGRLSAVPLIEEAIA